MMKKNSAIKLGDCLKKEFGEKLISVVLFGSFLRGKTKKYSDVDVLAVVDDLPEEKKRYELIVDIESKLDFVADIILLTPKELDISALNLSPLILSIFEGYELLYGKDLINYEKEKIKKFFVIEKISNLGWRIKEIAA